MSVSLHAHYLAGVSVLGVSSVEVTAASLVTSGPCTGIWDSCSSAAGVAMVASTSATAAIATTMSVGAARVGAVPGATTSAFLVETQQHSYSLKSIRPAQREGCMLRGNIKKMWKIEDSLPILLCLYHCWWMKTKHKGDQNTNTEQQTSLNSNEHTTVSCKTFQTFSKVRFVRISVFTANQYAHQGLFSSVLLVSLLEIGQVMLFNNDFEKHFRFDHCEGGDLAQGHLQWLH